MIKPVTYYVAVCDACGTEAEYGDYSAFSDESTAWDQAEYGDWRKIDGRHLCDDCIVWGKDGEPMAKAAVDA